IHLGEPRRRGHSAPQKSAKLELRWLCIKETMTSISEKIPLRMNRNATTFSEVGLALVLSMTRLLVPKRPGSDAGRAACAESHAVAGGAACQLYPLFRPDPRRLAV